MLVLPVHRLQRLVVLCLHAFLYDIMIGFVIFALVSAFGRYVVEGLYLCAFEANWDILLLIHQIFCNCCYVIHER